MLNRSYFIEVPKSYWSWLSTHTHLKSWCCSKKSIMNTAQLNSYTLQSTSKITCTSLKRKKKQKTYLLKWENSFLLWENQPIYYWWFSFSSVRFSMRRLKKGGWFGSTVKLCFYAYVTVLNILECNRLNVWVSPNSHAEIPVGWY